MIKKIGRAVIRTVQGVIVAVLALIVLVNLYTLAARTLFHVEDPAVLGCRVAVVLTGSMEPAIRADDLVLVHRQEDYDAGDIIMFRSGGSTVTHRVTAVTAEGYRTRGDANNTEDADTTPPEAVLGRVVLTLHGAGAVVRFLRTPLGALCLVLMVPVLVLAPDILQKRRRKEGESYGGRQSSGKTE